MEDGTVASLQEKGGNALAEGKLDKAIQFYSAAIELDPQNHVLYSHRSAVYGISDRFEEALSDAEKCVELKPDWNMGYARRGCALALLDRSTEAIASFKEMERIETNGGYCTEDQAKSSQVAKYDEMLNPYRMLDLVAKHEQDHSAPLSVNLDQADQDTSSVVDDDATPDNKKLENNPPEPSKASEPAPQKIKKNDAELKLDAIQAAKEKELGNKAYESKDFEAATAHYTTATTLDPGNITYLNNMAAVHYERAEYAACVSLCARAVDVGRENRADYTHIAKAFTRCGNAHKKQGELKLAKIAYEKSMSELRTPEIKALLSEVEKLIREEDRRANIDPVRADAEKEKGNECFKRGKYADALQHYGEAIRCNPDEAKYYSNRAACYTKLAAFDLGLKDCETCLSLDRTFIRGWIRKGKILQGMQQHNRAMVAYSQALELDTTSADALAGYRSCSASLSSDPDAVRQRAMADPEIMKSLNDPAMRMILDQMQTDTKALVEHMKNPEIAAKIQKLIAAGVIIIK